MNKQLAQQAKTALSRAITGAGLPLSTLPLLMLQLGVETAGFTSKVALQANNLSGIIYVKQKGARDSGLPLPSQERKKYGNYNYAAYDNLDNWAADYVGILKRKGILPASSIEQFAAKLKEGRYFTADLSDYKKALASWLPSFKKIFADLDFSFKQTGGAIVVIAIAAFIFLTLNK